MCIQYEVTAQELAAVLILFDVQKATDAVLSVHVRHRATGTFPGPLRPGREREEREKRREKRDWEEFLKDTLKREERKMSEEGAW